jgi:thioredoxin-related protein
LKTDVIIAKIDMTKSKLASLEVKSFPTIYFYPKEGESESYDGGRGL